MTTLQQWKEKLLDILDNTFYRKSEIDEKENVLNESIAEKLNISDAFSGDYNDLINKPNNSSIITIIYDEEDATDDGIYILNEELKTFKATVNTNEVRIGLIKEEGNFIADSPPSEWIVTDGDVIVDWGDGTTSIINNPSSETPLTHTYSDGEISHDIKFLGDIIDTTFSFVLCNAISSFEISGNITQLGMGCFTYCENLSSIKISDNIASIGQDCFERCNSLVDYQLYWTEDNIVNYDDTWGCTNDAIFTIPYGTTEAYVNAGYPEARLQERGA